MDPSLAEQEDPCWSKGARIGRSGGHIDLDGGDPTTAAPSSRSAFPRPEPLSPVGKRPSDSSMAQARTAPVGPPRGPFACVTPRGQIHGRYWKARLRVEPTGGQAFHVGSGQVSQTVAWQAT